MVFQLGFTRSFPKGERWRWRMGLGCNLRATLWTSQVAGSGSGEFILCDRFRLNDLLDWNEQHRIPIIPRVTRWSEASEDIRALRKMAKDGPLSVSAAAATLIGASLAVARVKSDDAGSMRLVKRGTNNQSRDDVAAALTCCGAYERARGKWVAEKVAYTPMVNP